MCCNFKVFFLLFFYVFRECLLRVNSCNIRFRGVGREESSCEISEIKFRVFGYKGLNTGVALFFVEWL